jgi:hypothetical protein
MAKSRTAQQSRAGDEWRQLRPLAIDWPERSGSDGQMPSAGPPKLMSAHDSSVHEAIDAISAVILQAQAGLNWLGAEKPNLEAARKALDSIAGDARRIAEFIVRFRKP